MHREQWKDILMITIVAGFIMLFQLGALPLIDPDEPVYAQTAKEMISAGDMISPRIYGDFWYDKPPMYYWLVAASFKIFGQSEFAARFPSAVFAVGGALLLYFAGGTLLGRRAGLIAALVLTTSIEYFYLGKAAVTDMTLTFFLSASLMAFLHERYYLAYASAALAVVTKGPVGILFPGAVIVIYLVVTRNFARLKKMKIFTGLAVFSCLALPWYAAMYYYHGMEFVETFLGFHNIIRFTQPEHPGRVFWYYYIPVLAVGFFPWISFLAQAVMASFKESDNKKKQVLIFLVVWLAFIFAFFTVCQTKLVSYILPMYPPMALLVGWYIDKALTEKDYRSLTWSGAAFTCFGVVLVAVLLIGGGMVGGGVMTEIIAASAILLAMLAGLWLSIRRQQGQQGIAAMVGGMALFVVVLMTYLFPAAVPTNATKAVAMDFRQYYDGQTPVFVAKFMRPGFAYYTDIYGSEIRTESQIMETVQNRDKAFFVIKEKAYQSLPAEIRGKLQLLSKQGDTVLMVK
jgi:4-amino-4-deoxy-L-arabinose transferase-like glycosyltransferase